MRFPTLHPVDMQRLIHRQGQKNFSFLADKRNRAREINNQGRYDAISSIERQIRVAPRL
jgi:hypothetical protein